MIRITLNAEIFECLGAMCKWQAEKTAVDVRCWFTQPVGTRSIHPFRRKFRTIRTNQKHPATHTELRNSLSTCWIYATVKFKYFETTYAMNVRRQGVTFSGSVLNPSLIKLTFYFGRFSPKTAQDFFNAG